MTTCARTHARTLDALAEEADAVNNIRQTAAEQALSNQRRAPASISQFRGFTAHDPPPPSSNSRRSVSADLRNSVPGGYYADPDVYGNNGPGDGPGDDPGDDPGEDDDDEDDEDWIDAEGDLDPNMAILNNLAVTISRLSCSARRNNELSSSQAKVWDPGTFDGTDPKKLRTNVSSSTPTGQKPSGWIGPKLPLPSPTSRAWLWSGSNRTCLILVIWPTVCAEWITGSLS